ncbi:hypothetical protein QYE76_040142 [Lolium multiflorum]|uniref:Retrotransposon Copia-like N-terminal domain-containing protein n=1 Tax=Lolium multiflorum TaxID=4521 RepID=A0AAD8WSY2_LOLMU|nr:hypothetical protein QYE76_040142 [Lolium multiflorum]
MSDATSTSMSSLTNPKLSFDASSSSSTSARPFSFAPLIIVRLNNDNYRYWCAEVVPVFRSHLLLGFVDGSFPCPPAKVDNPRVAEDPKAPRIVYNPEYTAWHHQDTSIIFTIMSTSPPQRKHAGLDPLHHHRLTLQEWLETPKAENPRCNHIGPST